MVRNRWFILNIVSLFLCFQVNGQHFFFHTDTIRTDPNFTSTTIYYGFFDVENCIDTIVQWTRGSGLIGTDIAILSQGDIYSYMLSRDSSPFGIAFTLLSERAYFQRGYFDDNNAIRALSCNGAGIIYGAGTGLSSYNPVNRDIRYLGDLPPEMQAAGDLTFREGKLYLSTISNTLVEVDVDNPMNSEVFMTFPEGTPPVHGMATIHSGCDVVTYAIGTHDSGSIIYEIDFDSKTLIERCRTDFRIMGAASPDECVIPTCSVLVDLDQNNSSGATKFDFRADTACITPISISDADVEVFAVETIDSITLILSGIKDIGEEYLEAVGVASVSVTDNNTTALTLVNNGGASPADFATVIQQIAYHNDAANPTSGEREVWLRAYTPNFSSEIATSYLYLSTGLILNKEVMPVTCNDYSNGSIALSADGGATPYTFQWSDGATDATRNVLRPGNYRVTVTDRNGCQVSDTIQLINPEPLILTIQTDADTICNQSGTLTVVATGGVSPYDYQWSHNNVTSDRIDSLRAGTYGVSVTDRFNCEVTTTYTLFERDGASTQENRTICQGEMYDFNGTLLSQDTTICQTFPANNGCDSTHCLTLRVLDRSSSISASICEGQTFLFGSRTLSVAGVYTDTIQDGGLCDSLIVLNLQVEPLPGLSITVEGGLCEGGTARLSAGSGFARYQWSNGATASFIDVSNPGSYSVTVTNTDGCTASDTIEIRDANLSATLTANDPTCFGKKDGSIAIDTVIGGTAPFFYAINGRTLQPSNIFGQLSSGTYQVRVEDVSGCFYETTITLQEPEPLTLNLGEDLTLTLGDSITLQAITNALNPLVQWDPPTGLNCDTCLIVIARPAESTRYEVTVSDPNGCVAKDDLSILINRRDGIFAPSAFSPNGDGVNDRFMIFTNSSVAKINYFRVFDRWGNLLYEARDFLPNDSTIGWDGNFQGKEMPAGSYVYAYTYEKIDGQEELMQGEVLLVR